MSKKKHDLSVEEMKKVLEIKITPREQKELHTKDVLGRYDK